MRAVHLCCASAEKEITSECFGTWSERAPDAQKSEGSKAHSFLVASYRRRMGVVAVREMARHRYRQSQYAGLTRLQLDQVGRERQAQRLGAERAEALAEGSVELAQAMIPRAHALARGGG